MNKKKFYIITTCCLIAIFIIFQIVMYYAVGEEVLSRKGPVRTLWLFSPIVIMCLTFVRNLIMKRKYEKNDKK